MRCPKDIVFIRTFSTPYMSKYLNTKDGKVIWVLITLTFKLCALLDNNHFVKKKIIFQHFVQKTPCSLRLSVLPTCPNL